MREGQERAGLGHPVAADDVDPTVDRRAGEGIGSAEPPMMTFQPRRSVVAEAGLPSIICRIVGTQCENVTLSRAISPSSTSGT